MTSDLDITTRMKEFGQKYHHVPELKFILDDGEGIEIGPLPEQGIINSIYLIKSADGTRTALIKYGTDHVQCEGAKHILIHLERQLLEFKSLELMYNLIPGSVPRPLAFDKDLSIICMEYLENYEIIGPSLLKGDINMETAGRIGKLLGQLHYGTHRNRQSEEEWKKLQSDFKDNVMKEAYRKVAFEQMFDEYASLYVAPENQEEKYQECLQGLLSKGLDKKLLGMFDKEDCFIHADCHADSFMTNGKDVKLIDFEFSQLGCPMNDISHVLSYYLLYGYKIHKTNQNKEEEPFKQTLKAVQTIVDAYLCVFGKDLHLLGKDWIEDLVLAIGHNLFRLSLFIPLRAKLCLDEETKLRFMTFGYHLLIRYEDIKSTDELLDIFVSIGEENGEV